MYIYRHLAYLEDPRAHRLHLKPSDIFLIHFQVRGTGECCIGDFGMAFSRSINQDDIKRQPMRSRAPKMLYAPPEFFSTFGHPLRETDFDELLAGDIYSMALLFWEISNKGMHYHTLKPL